MAHRFQVVVERGSQRRTIHFTPLDLAAARAVCAWAYPPPYDVYNLGGESPEATARLLSDPANGYYAVRAASGELLAFRCFGVEGQVPGGSYPPGALDTGGGLRPDLTGQGWGLPFLQAALDFGRQRYAPPAFRVTVAAFNQRALSVVQRAGFMPVQTFARLSDGCKFVILALSPA